MVKTATESEKKREEALFMGDDVFTFDFGGGGVGKEDSVARSDGDTSEEGSVVDNDDDIEEADIGTSGETDQERANRILAAMDKKRHIQQASANLSAKEVDEACEKFFPTAASSFLSLGKKSWKEAWGEYARHLHEALGKLYASEKKKDTERKKKKSAQSTEKQGKRKTTRKDAKKTSSSSQKSGKHAIAPRVVEIVTPKTV